MTATPPPLPVVQPPRTIVRGGETIDISELAGDALFEAITSDDEQWDYRRIAAESGRSVARVRTWVSEAYSRARSRRIPSDRAFVLPDGYVGGSPWWRAGRARQALMQMGAMTRDGVAIRYRPTGRAPGATDIRPRQRAAAIDAQAREVWAEYEQLRESGLSDRQARAQLAERHSLSRTQLARRLTKGRELAGAGPGQGRVDPAQLATRLAELVDEYRERGYTPSGADWRARAQLAQETGLSRRQIAGYIAAHTHAAGAA